MRCTLAACVLTMSGSAFADQLYNNGVAQGGLPSIGLGTGTLNSVGTSAPSGSHWSEVQPGLSVLGYSTILPGMRLSDDFTIGDPGGWTISDLHLYAYVGNAATTSSPLTSYSLRIWNGDPRSPASSIVFGDTTTNRLTSSVPANLYRTSNGAALLNRYVWDSTVTVGVTLGPGHYYFDYDSNGGTAGSTPPVTIMGSTGSVTANGLMLNGGAWTTLVDNGFFQDLPFVLNGTVACYANCDGSTLVPILNVNDFACFLNRYAAGNAYANCDNSTLPPTLNVNDFACFLNRYAAGCP